MTRCLLVLACVLASPAVTHAQKSERPAAKAALKKAKAHFDLQEYALAEEQLKEAYRIDPKPEILYAIAQAQRLGGACDRAIITYKNFLRGKPPAEQARQAEENIARCESASKPATVEPPKPEPVTVEPPKPELAPTPIVTTPPPRVETVHTGVPWTRNWVGHVFVLGGLAVAAGGTYVALDANRTITELNDAQFYDDFIARQAEADSAKSRRTVGFAVAGVGGAMVLTGALLYVLRSPGERSRPAVSIGGRGELMLAWDL